MKLTFVWQDCVVVGSSEANLITDPCFPSVQKIVSLDSLPHLNAIIVTTPEIDSLSWEVLTPLRRTIPVIAPRGTERKIRRHGFVNVYTVQSGKAFSVADMRVVTLPAGGHRESFSVLFSADKNVYFAGPTLPFDKMTSIGRTYEIDLALLPIGGRTRARQQGVMTPEEAADAAASLKAKSIVPIHWHPVRVSGTEVRPPGTPERFCEVVRQRNIGSRVRVLRPSDTIII